MSRIVALGVLLAGCKLYSGSGPTPDEHDARVIDAESGTDPEIIIEEDFWPTRGAAITVTDVTLTSPDAVTRGLRGGSVEIEFVDMTSGGGEVVFGTSPIGGCVVLRYVVFGTGGTPYLPVDADTVTITGPQKPVGPCNFVSGLGYRCTSNAGLADDVTITPGAQSTAAYELATADFTALDLVGSHLEIVGLQTPNESGSLGFPIVGQGGAAANTLTVLNPNAVAESATDAALFRVHNGTGPIPTSGGADAAFLGDATTMVRIQKGPDGDWPALDFEVYARGEGFTLADGSALPHTFSATAQDLVFTCAGPGGDCGAEGNASFEALVISGRTTDADLSTVADDFTMPAPVVEYATFECNFLLTDTGTIPMAAVDALLSTNPTRVEMRVLRAAGTVVQDGVNTGRILVGHGLVGHTDIP